MPQAKTTTDTGSSTNPQSEPAGPANIETMPPGMGPGVAMAAIYGSLAHSTGILYENAVAAQKQQTIAGDVLCFIAVLEALARSAPAAKTAASAVSDDEEVLKLLKALKAAA